MSDKLRMIMAGIILSAGMGLGACGGGGSSSSSNTTIAPASVLSSLRKQYLAAVAPANAAKKVFDHKLSAYHYIPPTVLQGIVNPMIIGIQKANDRLLAIAAPQSITPAIRALITADQKLIEDLDAVKGSTAGNADQLDGLLDWKREKVLANILRHYLGLGRLSMP